MLVIRVQVVLRFERNLRRFGLVLPYYCYGIKYVIHICRCSCILSSVFIVCHHTFGDVRFVADLVVRRVVGLNYAMRKVRSEGNCLRRNQVRGCRSDFQMSNVERRFLF